MEVENCQVCPICMGLSEETVDSLLAAASILELEKGQAIYSQGDAYRGIYVVSQGEICLSCENDDGRPVYVKKFNRGESFGESGMTEMRYLEKAFAVEKSVCIFVPGDELEKLMATHAELSMAVLKAVNKWLSDFYSRFKVLTYLSVRRRLELYLIAEAESLATNEWQLNLRNHEIATNLGIRPETLSRAFRELIDEGLVSFAERKLNVSTLVESANSRVEQ